MNRVTPSARLGAVATYLRELISRLREDDAVARDVRTGYVCDLEHILASTGEAAAERPTPAEETAYRAGFRAGRSAERAYGETLAPWAEDSAWTDYTDYTHEAAVFVNPLREAGAQARASVSVLLRSVARAQVLPPQAAPKSSPPASGAKHSAAPPAQEEQPKGCPDALLPYGPVCPRCGGPRAPSGVGGGSWVHFPHESRP